MQSIFLNKSTFVFTTNVDQSYMQTLVDMEQQLHTTTEMCSMSIAS